MKDKIIKERKPRTPREIALWRAKATAKMGGDCMAGSEPPPKGATAQDYGIYCLLRAVEDLAIAMEQTK